MLLDKRGNSDTPERMALLQMFIDHFGKNCIKGILKVDINALFYGLKPHEQSCLKGRRFVFGHLVYLSCLRLIDGELLIVATTELPETAIATYGLR